MTNCGLPFPPPARYTKVLIRDIHLITASVNDDVENRGADFGGRTAILNLIVRRRVGGKHCGERQWVRRQGPPERH